PTSAGSPVSAGRWRLLGPSSLRGSRAKDFRPDPLAASREGIVPEIRIGRRWISILWTSPTGGAGLVFLIAVAQSLRELPGIQAFIKAYPGIAQAAPSADTGFP